MIKKSYLKLQVLIVEIGELIHVQRVGIPDLHKRILVVETVDKQVLYPELRNVKLELLQNIEENSIVEIEFTFEGSEKNGKRYNNIYINSMIKL